MQYLSPYRLLNLSPLQSIDKQAINLAKKKFLAEIELSPTQTILLGVEEMTKNDVLVFFEKFSEEHRLSYHYEIAERGNLLAVLEGRLEIQYLNQVKVLLTL